jgi:DNA polymerase V
MSCILLGDSYSFLRLNIPLFLERVSAGFPSPAEDYIEKTLDLNELCIQHPAATFFVRVEGESMIGAGIFPGDVLVVDRSLRAQHGDIIIASLESEMTVKELHLIPPPVYLLPRNLAYKPILIEEGMVLEVFGVVTNVVRSLKRGGKSS